MEIGADKKLLKNKTKVETSSSIDWDFQKNVMVGDDDGENLEEAEVNHHLENEGGQADFAEEPAQAAESKEPPYCVVIIDMDSLSDSSIQFKVWEDKKFKDI